METINKKLIWRVKTWECNYRKGGAELGHRQKCRNMPWTIDVIHSVHTNWRKGRKGKFGDIEGEKTPESSNYVSWNCFYSWEKVNDTF